MIDWIVAIFCSLTGLCGGENCREINHAGVPHVVCSYRTSDISVKMLHSNAEGKAFASLVAVSQSLSKNPQMLMNGGMYHEDLHPVGLYVEAGVKKQKLSTKAGWGNFHLLPNGVFWGKGGKVYVSETKSFARKTIKPDFATQSGPMLVINGKLHPRFIKGSDSLKIRNGVGVSADGRWLHFAISQRSLNFYDFGMLFRDTLETPNALYLDGTVSAIAAEGYRQGGWRPLGPIIGIFAR